MKHILWINSYLLFGNDASIHFIQITSLGWIKNFFGWKFHPVGWINFVFGFKILSSGWIKIFFGCKFYPIGWIKSYFGLKYVRGLILWDDFYPYGYIEYYVGCNLYPNISDKICSLFIQIWDIIFFAQQNYGQGQEIISEDSSLRRCFSNVTKYQLWNFEEKKNFHVLDFILFFLKTVLPDAKRI